MKTFALSYFRGQGKARACALLFLVQVAFAFSEANLLGFNFVDARFAATLTAPTKGEEDSEYYAAGSAGIRLSFDNADFRSYVTLPKTSFSELEIPQSLNDARYGGSLSLFQKSVPLTLKAGRLSYSRSMTRLKTPNPSYSANPLKKSFSFSPGLSPSLPTQTSSVQPVSGALSVSGKKLNLPVLSKLNADIMANEEDTVAASIYFRTKLSKSVYFDTAFTGGQFYLEKETSYLKKNNALFAGGTYKAFCAETAFRSPLFKANISAGVHESPYSSPYSSASAWFDLKTRAAYKAFLLDCGFFAIPTSASSPFAAPLIGADSSICKTITQVSVNPQIIFPLRLSSPSFLRLGANVTGARKLTGTYSVAGTDVLKISAGVLFESTYFDVKTVFTAANLLLSERATKVSLIPEESYTLSLSASKAARLFAATASASLKYCPAPLSTSYEKHIINAALSLTPGKTRRLTLKGSLYHYIKDNEPYSSTLQASASYKLKTKYVHSTVKITAVQPFKYY